MVDVEPSPAIQIDAENRAFHRHMSHNMSGPTVTIPSRFTLQEDRCYHLLIEPSITTPVTPLVFLVRRCEELGHSCGARAGATVVTRGWSGGYPGMQTLGEEFGQGSSATLPSEGPAGSPPGFGLLWPEMRP